MGCFREDGAAPAYFSKVVFFRAPEVAPSFQKVAPAYFLHGRGARLFSAVTWLTLVPIQAGQFWGGTGLFCFRRWWCRPVFLKGYHGTSGSRNWCQPIFPKVVPACFFQLRPAGMFANGGSSLLSFRVVPDGFFPKSGAS